MSDCSCVLHSRYKKLPDDNIGSRHKTPDYSLLTGLEKLPALVTSSPLSSSVMPVVSLSVDDLLSPKTFPCELVVLLTGMRKSSKLSHVYSIFL